MGLFRHRRDYELPQDWEDQVGSVVARWSDYSVEERTTLRDHMVRLLGEKRWEAANGFTLTEEMRLVISAQAAMLILGLDWGAYRKVGDIIVHPTTLVLQGERASASMAGLMTDEPMAILGQADRRRLDAVQCARAVEAAASSALSPARHHRLRNLPVPRHHLHRLSRLSPSALPPPPANRSAAPAPQALPASA